MSVNRVRNAKLEREANERRRTEAAARLARGAEAAEAAARLELAAEERRRTEAAEKAEKEVVMAEIKAAPLTPKEPEADTAEKEELADVMEEEKDFHYRHSLP